MSLFETKNVLKRITIKVDNVIQPIIHLPVERAKQRERLDKLKQFLRLRFPAFSSGCSAMVMRMLRNKWKAWNFVVIVVFK